MAFTLLEILAVLVLSIAFVSFILILLIMNKARKSVEKELSYIAVIKKEKLTPSFIP